MLTKHGHKKFTDFTKQSKREYIFVFLLILYRYNWSVRSTSVVPGFTTLTLSVFFRPGWEERSLFSGGRSGRPRPVQAGGGRVGAGAAEQAEGRQRSTRAQLRLLKPLHAGRVLARWCHSRQPIRGKYSRDIQWKHLRKSLS